MSSQESGQITQAPSKPGARNGAARSAVAVRGDLAHAEERLQRHVRQLRREMTLGDVTLSGAPLLDHVRRRPFLTAGLVVAGAAGVALLVSLMSGSESEPDESEELRKLMRGLQKEIASHGSARDQTVDALRRALGGNAPIVVLATDDGGSRSPGILGSAVRAAISSLMGVAGKVAVEAIAGDRSRNRTE